METEGWKKVLLWGSFIFFLGSLLLRQESAITQDLGRHLRLGEMIVAGGPPNGEAREARKCALYSNCLTYTYPDYPFINHHWGSEVIFYFIHKAGGFPALIVLKAIILGSAFSITLFHSLELNKGQAFLKRPGLLRPAVAIVLVFFSVQMMADRLTTRPEIFGYLFFSLVFFILSRSNIKCYITFFVLPIIMLLWTNLHISFIFGLILIWTWAISKCFMSLRGAERRGNLEINTDRHAPISSGLAMTAVAVAVISTLVTLLNPSGLRGTLMPLSILKDYGYTIVENMTPFFLTAFKPQPEYWVYAIILTAAIVLFIFSPAKKNPFHLLTFLTFSLFPLTAVRHLPFFALIIPPVLAPLLKDRILQFHWKDAILPWLTTGGLIFAATTNPALLVNTKLPPMELMADLRHEPAIEFVKQNNLKGSMWNNYDIGSFLEWAIPQRPTFVDGRPEAFPVGFFRQTYIPMQENKEVWDRAIAGYDIQWTFVALTDATPWFIKWWKMIQNHEDWRIVYIDNYSTILIRVNGNNNLIEPQGGAKLLKMPGLD